MLIDKRKLAANRQLDALTEGRFERMANVLPEGQQGVAQIDHFTISPLDMVQSIAHYGEEFIPPGTYARLKVNGETMMSDTPMERRTNLEFVQKARGRVLIAGLGLGMVVRALLRKPGVTMVIVLEKFEDVANLVLPSFEAEQGPIRKTTDEQGYVHYMLGTKLEIIITDVGTWAPAPLASRFHTIYFDIWPNSHATHLPEMRALYKRYRPLLAKHGWMDSWTHTKLKAKESSNRRLVTQLPALLQDHWNKSTPAQFAERTAKLLAMADEFELTDAERQVIRRFAAAKGISL